MNTPDKADRGLMRLRRRSQKSRLFGSWAERGPFLSLAFLMVLAFLIGGGARADISSLMILRPVAILLLGYGLWGLKWQQVRLYGHLFGLAVAILLLTSIQLVPLPPEVWSGLPGREVVDDIDRLAGLGRVWRPISLAPVQTWNALYALILPLSVLVLGARLRFEELSKLLYLVLGFCLLSALLALLQVLGPANGPLYFYRITNSGAAVGLFANRNHSAFLLALTVPLCAVFASLPKLPREPDSLRTLITLIASAFVVPLIFVTGSRAGLIGGLIGLVLSLMLVSPQLARSSVAPKSRASRPSHGPAARHHHTKGKFRKPWVFAAVGGLLMFGVAAFTINSDRAEAWRRIIDATGTGETRFNAWPSIIKMVWQYFPVGSGFGSFVEVYKLDEPREWLDDTYLNHAHNDYLEALLTGGAPAVALLAYAAGLFAFRLVYLFRNRKHVTERALFARLGMVLIILMALASIPDYPLRTPSLAALFALAALWAATPVQSLRTTD